MSQRFFFDVSDGEEIIPDEEGVEAWSLDEVLAEAQGVIAEMEDEVTLDDLSEPWVMIVRDQSGSVLGRLPIKR